MLDLVAKAQKLGGYRVGNTIQIQTRAGGGNQVRLIDAEITAVNEHILTVRHGGNVQTVRVDTTYTPPRKV